MEIIPVIDVRHGAAVRARGGDRARYRPLETPLAPSADPVAVARGYLSLCPFRTLYVADLDGIEGRGANRPLIALLVAALPGVELWIDDGSSGPPFAEPNIVRVIGSESLTFPSPHTSWGEGHGGAVPPARGEGQRLAPSQASASHPNPLPARGERGIEGCVLSLDFRGEEFLGPPEVLDNVDLWPERVIVMTLASVGMGAGPDLVRVAGIVARAGERRVYAAGGVRGLDDLLALKRAGAAGALVATALHEGKIKAGDLIEIAGA
jgi:phosphoribosylformimino-5-aminoimidazole carboxamide ribotide isomerase